MRTPLVVGNWKLHLGLKDAQSLARALVQGIEPDLPCEVGVAPVFTVLQAVASVLEGSPIALCAQDLHWVDKGPYTGAVGAPFLVELGCRYVIVGHSERRQHFGENDRIVRLKVEAALRGGLAPIACVGESLTERERGEAFVVVRRQVEAIVEGLDGVERLVIAYEPVWAIGTGKVAEPQDAQAMHAAIREIVARHAGQSIANAMRILYGGSVKPENAPGLLREPDIDGALVGGASLDARSFLAIIHAVRP
ncbi:MAG: triose-phosphate isomerase [Sandaracinaceae bacterium]|nr:triose-phosphate isomerase [Sandaracinaceae bacterium]MDW8246599.1 triose-phosphate isomerase [Sandaracinaceae bacterium]